MSEIAPNAFIGRTAIPLDEDLSAALGPSARAAWDQLVAALAERYRVDGLEWNSYSPKAGWSLRLRRGKRTILYLAPCRGSFLAAFALSAKAVDGARQSDLPPQILEIIAQARRYAEGTAVRIPVVRPSELGAVLQLAALKLAG